MRVSPRELRGIRAEGLLTRFAILGPVAFVSVELPASGSAGTGLEKPTQNEAWGIVLSGTITLHGPVERQFVRGTAFHVPAGPADHWFTAPGRAVLAGFAPMTREIDTSDAGIRALGFEPVARLPVPPPPPSVIAPAAGGSTFRAQGSIEVETAEMGQWIFTRTSYGPLSGYTSGWCDLPHWGMVLSGDLALRFESEVELLAAGDVYYCPAGAPGHQFQVADTATTIDYTPASALFGPGRKAEWRIAASRQLRRAPVPAGRSARQAKGSRRPDRPGEDDPTPKASAPGGARIIPPDVGPAPVIVQTTSVARSLPARAPLRRSRRTPVWVARDPLRPAGTGIG